MLSKASLFRRRMPGLPLSSRDLSSAPTLPASLQLQPVLPRRPVRLDVRPLPPASPLPPPASPLPHPLPHPLPLPPSFLHSFSPLFPPIHSLLSKHLWGGHVKSGRFLVVRVKETQTRPLSKHLKSASEARETGEAPEHLIPTRGSGASEEGCASCLRGSLSGRPSLPSALGFLSIRPRSRCGEG